MKKTPNIFKRNVVENGFVSDEKNNVCEWVFEGYGVATRKYDGSCCKVENGIYYKRRMVKQGKVIPEGFVEEEFDKNTGKRVGWIKVDNDSSEDKWHREAWTPFLKDGTYELLGPRIQGNPEQFASHLLLKHSRAHIYINCPRSFSDLAVWLKHKDIEGIVFHHPDGRMAKIRKCDFGFNRIEKKQL